MLVRSGIIEIVQRRGREMRVPMRLGRAPVARLCGLMLAATALLPGTAAAVNVGEAPTEGAAGLPEGRGYELVSPAIKHGTEAGYAESAKETGESPVYAVASGTGTRVLYTTGAPAGSTNTAAETYALSERLGPGDWRTVAALPSAITARRFGLTAPGFFYPSADLSRFAFTAVGAFAGGADVDYSPNIYVTRGTSADPALGNLVEPTWLAAPQIAAPRPALGQFRSIGQLLVDGASSDLNTVFFEYAGTLLPEDEAREEGAPGFYEWKDGVLHNAGKLPEGGFSPSGARAAAHVSTASKAPEYFNQVSTDGSRAFFTSVPLKGGAEQIYVRADGERTVLVSRDELLREPGHPPVPSPTPPVAPLLKTVIYASPDGSRVFFVDDSQLTASAPEGSAEKVYEFNVATETLTYLPGVAFGKGPGVLALSQDGAKLMYVDEVTKPWHINMWQESTAGVQQNTEVATFQRPLKPEFESARATADGGVFVFTAKAEVKAVEPTPVGASLKTSSAYVEVYRFDSETNELSCVSCPGTGAPTGAARISNDDATGANRDQLHERPVSSRGINADGSEVFFNTAQPLVKGDVNRAEDVYEWRAGHVYLISSGTSPQAAYLLDNSDTGSDVFFATTAALVPGDVEGGYDVYDARIGGGAAQHVEAGECAEGCQSLEPTAFPPTFLSAQSGISGNLAPRVERKGTQGTTRKSSDKAAKKRRQRLAVCRKSARRHKSEKKRRRALGKCTKRYGHTAGRMAHSGQRGHRTNGWRGR